jgi:hypothetical protein
VFELGGLAEQVRQLFAVFYDNCVIGLGPHDDECMTPPLRSRRVTSAAATNTSPTHARSRPPVAASVCGVFGECDGAGDGCGDGAAFGDGDGACGDGAAATSGAFAAAVTYGASGGSAELFGPATIVV